MDASAMTIPAFALAASLAVGLIAGLFGGLFHFASLWWNTRLLVRGDAAKAAGTLLGRLAMTVALLTALSMLGASSLLGGALGFLLARGPLLRRFGEPR
jgi:F1F0 ATPase subunit 2